MGNLYADNDNFEVGEDVMFKRAGSYSEVRGTVRKVTAARVTVESIGSETTVLHRSKYGVPFQCRRTSEADRKRDTWLVETTEWERARPTSKHFFLSRWFAHGDFRVRMDSQPTATLEVMQEITDEAHAIREWLRKRPVEPRP